MIFHSVIQGSPDWQALRAGIPTASEFARIVTPTGALSRQSAPYMHKLIAERILGRPLDSPTTGLMEQGSEMEPEAASYYEMLTGVDAVRIGFVTNEAMTIGCSPDRLVGERGLLEIKCPAPQTHVGYMLLRSVDKAYWPQIQGQLYVTERDWVDIISYARGMQHVVIRVDRDEAYIAKLAEALDDFIEQMDAAMAQLRADGYIPETRAEKKANAVPVEDWLGITDQDVAELFAKEPHGATT